MEVHSTSRCHEFAHPEIFLDVAEVVPRERVDSLVSTLESMVAAGSVFRPGETLQYGWSLLKFQSDGQGGLFLMEPDMSTRPIQYRGGVTETLVTNMRQVYTLDSYAIARQLLDFPMISNSAIICHNFATAERIHLSRVEKKGTDSGWFFGCYKMECDHQSAARLRSVPLVDAVAQRLEISNWLALPSDVNVLLQPGQKPTVYRDGERASLIPGSFVDQLLK
jgi:hypothetical protein